jgi:hypothetical protein
MSEQLLSNPFPGSLFTSDFLTHAIFKTPEWNDTSEHELESFKAAINTLFTSFTLHKSANESQTESDLIYPLLDLLDWKHKSNQINLSIKGRDDVPDAFLFRDLEHKEKAIQLQSFKQVEQASVIVEAKRFNRTLDRKSSQTGEENTPTNQMLRYLRRADDFSKGKLRWGILTNGNVWRLYFAGARSISENFFEIDIARILGLPGHEGGLFALNEMEKTHWFKVFYLLFRREAFFETKKFKDSLHQRAIEGGKAYEERVASSLSDLVFGSVFPTIARAITELAPDNPLEEVREAALILLYRLLFILYAEDRDLLPIREERYKQYSLRETVRFQIKKDVESGVAYSSRRTAFWNNIQDICKAIDEGDKELGLPPYNGGLFNSANTPLLNDIKIGDQILAKIIDNLSFISIEGERKYINYRDLSVQQLGSIYERLLEHELKRDDEGMVDIAPNIFARKGSGSYYTPHELVQLIIEETIKPLIDDYIAAFKAACMNETRLKADFNTNSFIIIGLDPARKILNLKICDPAMGSGHFLVALVDYLSDKIAFTMAEATQFVKTTFGEEAHYISPLLEEINNIRATIYNNAREGAWKLDDTQLEDRHILRRMVLKRCIYGVDKNHMAVELAKVSLWLHTFTVGAPLSFIDHHLRCGDSLFGEWVKNSYDLVSLYNAPLFLNEPMREAIDTAAGMELIAKLTDAEITEAHLSKRTFEGVLRKTHPMNSMLLFIHALRWLEVKDKQSKTAINEFFDGQYGDPIKIISGKGKPKIVNENEIFERFMEIFNEAKTLIKEERFMNWQLTFPEIWSDWNSGELIGGFDAIVGNPPWDKMKLQQVEWFASRDRQIAMMQRASDRKKAVTRLEKEEAPLALDYKKAEARSFNALKRARESGDYPLLSGGDVNLYSLFVERAMKLLKPHGMAGLLVPSGIASDKTASVFFGKVAKEQRLKSLYDFENKKVFFPDVHASFKFCVFISSKKPRFAKANTAFYLHHVKELEDKNRCFQIDAASFSKVNPQTGTAPIFRNVRDKDLTLDIYARIPTLVDVSSGEAVKTWDVKYATMFHMSNDSHLFKTREELEEAEGAVHIGKNRWKSKDGDWLPLYVGRMIYHFDHRAASVSVNEENLHNPANSLKVTLKQKIDPKFYPKPQFFVLEKNIQVRQKQKYYLAFRDIARATDARTCISAIVPKAAFGNKAPLLLSEISGSNAYLLCSNLNSFIFDFITRQKIQGTSLNWYIVEQLPVIPPAWFTAKTFGTKTALQIVKEAVLELTYTAHDMEDFAIDMGYVDDTGKAKQPFIWDEERRLHLRAKLDALFFILYGITNRDDVKYIFSTFPIVEREETALYGSYRSRDLTLAYINALNMGEADMVVE